jgi:hypothetical protein
MATQMKGGSFQGRGAKAGTRVAKFAMPTGRLFRPDSGRGITAHGQPKFVESRGEAKDRELG